MPATATSVLPLVAVPLPASASPLGLPLSENSRLGFPSLETARRQGWGAANSLNASGMRECLYDSGRRSRCTGKERDAETGLDFFGARYFSGAQGRFSSADEPFADQNPEDPQSWNLYSYVRNNPLRFTDLDGRKCVNGKDDISSEFCIAVDVTGKKDPPKKEPRPDVVLDSPLFLAVARGVQQAKPGVDLAGMGLMTFFSFINPFAAAATTCLADPASCSKVDLAMAVLPIHITPGGLKHVLDRHTLGGVLNVGKSVFNAGEDISSLIKAGESVNAVKQAGGTLERVVDAGGVIGTDRATGGPTSVYTVITRSNGDLVTAFPGKP
jgi:RHS repeat-associated protein